MSQYAQLDRSYKRDGVEAVPQEHLVRVFIARLGAKAAAALGKRIEILDVQKLCDFLVSVAPEALLNEWGPKLGLVRLLDDIDVWGRVHRLDRVGAPFAYDTRREAIRDELLAFFDQAEPVEAQRAARLLGPPGIGKTRLVLESLSGRPDLAARLRVARESSEAAEVFQQAFWTSHPEAIVVVDDCPDEEVRGLVATFAAKATHPKARLLLITPTKESSRRSQLRSWTVEPLADDRAHLLLGATLPPGIDEGTKAQIVSLAEGFPWFVLLLAQEAGKQLRGPRNMDEAIDWVLASSTDATGTALVELRQDRARALLAVALTRSHDWGNATEEEQERLVRAVGLSSWPRLRDLAQQCHQRGLVRLQHGWYFKYVTPAVLEREILLRLLGPEGPDPGGKVVFRETGLWAQQLFARLPSLGLSLQSLRAIADLALQDLRTLERLDDLAPHALVGERLLLIATYAPGPCARELRRLLASAADLRAFTTGRRDVLHALERVLLHEEGLEDAEASLFLLALAENERYSNNATALWSDIFLVEMTFVRHAIDLRLGLLKARLEAVSAEQRLLALRGLEALLASPGFRLVPQGAGKPVSLPPDALHHVRIEAWRLLGERMHDQAEPVACAARALAQTTLAAGGPPGVLAEALDRMLESADTFRDQERIALVEVVQSSERLERSNESGVTEKLRALRAKLTPRSFHERLREQVGRWGDRPMRVGITEQDEALAREALENLARFEPELGWLLSEHALRGQLFARALGRHDRGQALLPLLLERATTTLTRSFVAAYVGGLKDGLSEDRFRTVLASLRERPTTFPLFALAAAWCGLRGDDAHAIGEALSQGRLDEETALAVVRFAHGVALAVEDLRALVEGALARGGPALLQAALGLLAAHLERKPEDARGLGVLVDEVLMRYASGPGTVQGDRDWEKLALARMEQHRAVVLASVLALLEREGGPPLRAWGVLHQVAERDPRGAWKALAACLERGDKGTARLLTSFRFWDGELPLPVDEVLAWVGEEEQRGRAVAALAPPFQATLPEVLRRLVARFGPEGSVGREIEQRMYGTTRGVPSLAVLDEERLELASAWLQDEEPAVRALARRLVRSLEESHAYHRALEAEERLRYGS